jgi:hypothetical protein
MSNLFERLVERMRGGEKRLAAHRIKTRPKAALLSYTLDFYFFLPRFFISFLSLFVMDGLKIKPRCSQRKNQSKAKATVVPLRDHCLGVTVGESGIFMTVAYGILTI